MRNLKKVLSLVLCMAVMLSVMVVGAGAAFKDQEKINNAEAVDACAALNIINGYTDGSFRPEGTITRAEACKMICVALNGGKEPVLGTSATASFTDTKGHWAEGYIESCVAQGIVAGVGGGKFNPNGNVTGSQFAKMLLIALGYNAQHAQFLGNAWEVNVNVVATQKNLYEDLETMDVSAALTRDNAAQMVWNALQAIMVEYKYTLITDANGNLTSQITVEDKENYNYQQEQDNGDGWLSLLEAKYDATVVETTVDTVSHNAKGYIINGTYSKLAEDPTDFVGKAVKILCSDVDEVYGIYVDTDETMIDVTATVADLDKYTDGNTKFEVGDIEYKVLSGETDATVELIDTIGGTFTDDDAVLTLGDIAEVASMGSQITVIDNDGDEKIDVVRVTPVTVAKVNYVSDSSITLTAPEKTKNNAVAVASIDTDSAVIYDGIAKGDYVAVIDDDYNAEGNYVIEKVNTVEGTVKGMKSDKVMIDGTWYSTAHITETLEVGSNVKVVVLNDVVYGVCDVNAIATTNYLVLTSNINDDYGDVKAKAVFADSSRSAEVITISKVYDFTQEKYIDATTGNVNKDYLYAYKVVDGEYQLMKVDLAISQNIVEEKLGYDAGASDKDYTDKKIDGKNIDNNAIVFVKDTDGTKVISGKDVIAWKTSVTAANSDVETYLYDTVNGYDYVKVAYITLTVENPGASSDKQYALVTADPYASELDNGDAAYAVELFDGSSKDSVFYLDKNNHSVNYAKGDIVSYTVSSDGIVKIDAVVADKAATKGALDTDELYIVAIGENDDGETTLKFKADDANKTLDPVEYTVTKDTKILYINSKDTVGVLGGAIAMANTDSYDNLLDGQTNAYIKAKADSNGVAELELLVIDVNNNIWAD